VTQTSKKQIRALGIDPGLAATGYAVAEALNKGVNFVSGAVLEHIQRKHSPSGFRKYTQESMR